MLWSGVLSNGERNLAGEDLIIISSLDVVGKSLQELSGTPALLSTWFLYR